MKVGSWTTGNYCCWVWGENTTSFEPESKFLQGRLYRRLIIKGTTIGVIEEDTRSLDSRSFAPTLNPAKPYILKPKLYILEAPKRENICCEPTISHPNPLPPHTQGKQPSP